jgi:hypothetical protein
MNTIDFSEVQTKMRDFNTKYQRLPNVVLIPAEIQVFAGTEACSSYTSDRTITLLFGMKVIFSAVEEIRVGLVY